MKIKRFVAPEMRSAIRQVREDQGPDAVILSNRNLDGGGVEIIAAVDYDEALVNQALAGRASEREKRPEPRSGERVENARSAHASDREGADESAEGGDGRDWLADTSAGNSGRNLPADSVNLVHHRSRPSTAVHPDSGASGSEDQDEELEVPGGPESGSRSSTPASDKRRIVWSQEPNLMEVRRELSNVRKMLENHFTKFAWDRLTRERPLQAGILRKLSAMGVESDLADQVIRGMPSTEDAQQAQRLPLGVLARCLPVGDDRVLQTGGRVALVGPTGVGKTTTIAKLAARFALSHGKRHVALISTDNYRLGAQQQLHGYGRILGVPVYSVSGATELRETLLELESKALILVDSAGMSQRDSRIPRQLGMLSRAEGQQLSVQLVLSAGTRGQALEETVQAYKTGGLDGCILTKLDEATSLGGALSVAARHELPIEYITDGQRVPEDIHAARSHRLVSRAVQLQRHWPENLDEADLAERLCMMAAQSIA